MVLCGSSAQLDWRQLHFEAAVVPSFWTQEAAAPPPSDKKNK